MCVMGGEKHVCHMRRRIHVCHMRGENAEANDEAEEEGFKV